MAHDWTYDCNSCQGENCPTCNDPNNRACGGCGHCAYCRDSSYAQDD